MRSIIPACLILLCATFANAQTWNWAMAFLGTGLPRVGSVAALADGGALVCGEFNDSLRTSTDTIVTHGDWDGFLARLDNSGAVLWLTAIGGDGYDELNEVVVDADGNAFAAATFTDTASWGGTDITGGLGREATLVKFDLDGNVLWYRRAEGFTLGYTVSVSTNGTAYLGGVISEFATFGGIDLESSAGIGNAFIARYTASAGTIIDAGVVSSSSGDFGALGMDVDGDGNVYYTGYSRPQPNPYVGSFVGRIAYGSGTNWIQTVTSASGDVYGYDVSATTDGHVYYTGKIHNNVTWMGQPLGQFGRQRNAYLARFAADGTLDWVQQYGSTNVDEGLGVVSDGLGNAYWTGKYTGPVAFDTITVNFIGTSISQDIFVARTEPAGGVAWVSRAGGAGLEDFGTAIDKRVNGPLIVGGQYASFQATFGSIPMPAPFGQRCFVASMGVPDDDLTTGLPSTSTAMELHVYPVPAQNELFVAFQGARGALTCMVLDASGRMVEQSTLGAPLGAISVAHLAPGLYTLVCKSADDRLRAARFVVER